MRGVPCEEISHTLFHSIILGKKGLSNRTHDFPTDDAERDCTLSYRLLTGLTISLQTTPDKDKRYDKRYETNVTDAKEHYRRYVA